MTTRKMLLGIAASTLGFLLARIGSTRAQRLPQSPCPDIFTYRVDPSTNAYFGHIDIDSGQVLQHAHIVVDVAIDTTELSENNIGSLGLVKSTEGAANDIRNGQPVQYRVDFPPGKPIPTVTNIAFNGQSVCTGTQAENVATVQWKHSLCAQAPSPHCQQSRPQPQQNWPQRQQPVQRTPPPPIYEVQRTTTTRPPYRLTFPPRTQPPRPRIEPSTTTESDQQLMTVEQPQRQSSFSCGRAASASLNLLSINGERASKGQFPWIVPLFDRTTRRNPKHICGSTIINPKHLITAAHCVYDVHDFMSPQRLLACPGMYNIDNFFDSNVQLAYVQKVFPHENYDHDDDLNDADVALLRLEKTLTFSENVIPICVWQGGNGLTDILDQEAFVAGWGRTESASYSSVPMFIKTYIVDQRSCGVNTKRQYHTGARIFCGDGRGSVPCNGDSGSGLVMLRGNKYYLRGIVSKGLLNPDTLMCDETKYAIYTDVAPFRHWLKETVDS